MSCVTKLEVCTADSLCEAAVSKTQIWCLRSHGVDENSAQELWIPDHIWKLESAETSLGTSITTLQHQNGLQYFACKYCAENLVELISTCST